MSALGVIPGDLWLLSESTWVPSQQPASPEQSQTHGGLGSQEIQGESCRFLSFIPSSHFAVQGAQKGSRAGRYLKGPVCKV